MNNEELMHYGVPGMKWGVIRWKDKRAGNKLKRHLAADKRNMKLRGRMASDAEQLYDKEYKNYRKALSTPALTKKRKMRKVDKATRELETVSKSKEEALKEFHRAKRIYEADAKKYQKHVSDMMDKYGPENVKSISTKNVKMGKRHVEEVIRTGITVADLPLVGGLYSGRTVSKKDYADRHDITNEKSSQRY